MTERLLERPREGETPAGPPDAAAVAEALRRATAALETAERRLRTGDAAGADDALRLLRETAAHLERALAPSRRPR